MSPRRLKKKAVKRLVEKRMAKAIEEYEKTRANLDNAEKGVVGLRRWIEKVEQPFEICKCAEEDKVMFAASTFEGRALTWWNENPTTLHEAINMARELVELAVQGKAARVSESNKRKWEDQQWNNHHQQQNQRQETAKAYVVAPAKGRGYYGNLPWCNKCKAHHQPGLCPPRCSKCYKLSHEEEDCQTRIPELEAFRCIIYQLNSGDQSSLREIDCEIS
uniref:Reverse transcriptase domain-containing protein n=1 Tax=Tanacetum cinerariifolium TaxID=118510 RepID=A0A6L2N6U5_TANCI|nr:reverse transcriptase domain-containing protein [Tanacetum cinerariifolium]